MRVLRGSPLLVSLVTAGTLLVIAALVHWLCPRADEWVYIKEVGVDAHSGRVRERILIGRILITEREVNTRFSLLLAGEGLRVERPKWVIDRTESIWSVSPHFEYHGACNACNQVAVALGAADLGNDKERDIVARVLRLLEAGDVHGVEEEARQIWDQIGIEHSRRTSTP
jgi:hypothetical protein